MTLEQRVRLEQKNLDRADRDIQRGKHIRRHQLRRAEAKRMLAVLDLVKALPPLPA